MLNEPTIEKLKALRLDALCAAWAEQQKSPEIGQLSFDERLGLLVDAEHLARENKRLGRQIRTGGTFTALVLPAGRTPGAPSHPTSGGRDEGGGA